MYWRWMEVEGTDLSEVEGDGVLEVEEGGMAYNDLNKNTIQSNNYS